MTAVNHQKMMTAKWHKACDEWKGMPHPFPQLAMYGFHRNYGYVAFQGRFSMWRRTKRQAIADFEARYGKNGCNINE